MSDSAKGSAAGYIFQFEKALLMLSKIENESHYISVEDVDDIANHTETGTIVMTVQAKHSIVNSGTTFEDTSYALWRTIQIWIEKLEKSIFNDSTKFICSTNKVIPEKSLLSKATKLPCEKFIELVELVLQEQKGKIKQQVGSEDKKSITKIIKLIEFALSKKTLFEIILKNLQIEDNVNTKEKFLLNIHISSDKYSDTNKDAIYCSMLGWMIDNCLMKWRNGSEARISKASFNEKIYYVFSNPTIINAVFRTKESLGSINDIDVLERRKDLFVKQIEDINRNEKAKERIIKEAIVNFIYSDIELSYVITKGEFTKTDLDEFYNLCFESWQTCFDEIVIDEINNYSEIEQNKLAIKIFDKVMNNIDIKFKANYSFTPANKYVRNGSFLKLSNVPTIGWHPDWETKYKHK